FALFSAGLYEEAIAAYDAALAVCRERGDSVRAPAILSFRGRALTLAGNLEAALADLNESLIAQSSAAAVPYAIAFWASALLDRGKFDEAAAVIAGPGGARDRAPLGGVTPRRRVSENAWQRTRRRRGRSTVAAGGRDRCRLAGARPARTCPGRPGGGPSPREQARRGPGTPARRCR